MHGLFFKMVDDDGGGTIPMDEFLMGCLRLRGQARAVDVGRVIHDQQWMIKNFGKFQTHVEVQLKELKAELCRLLEAQESIRSPRSSTGSQRSHASECSNSSRLDSSSDSRNSAKENGNVVVSLPITLTNE